MIKIEKLLILTLLALPRVGRRTVRNIITSCNSEIRDVPDLLQAIREARKDNKRIPDINIDQLNLAYNQSMDLYDKTINSGIQIISEYDQHYPQKYNSIKDKPLLLYAKGNLKALNTKYSIAVIGTRDPSGFGIRACKKLTNYFVKGDFVIVSGLAVGCDTVAHEAALNNNGFTVGILASGLDNIYPKQNIQLTDRILDNNGTIISEYPVGTKPQRNFFVDRDRLQSGLSDAICIIETAIKGGTMHTYRFAIEQNRLVSALRHPDDKKHDKSLGNEKMINDKSAYPLGNQEEIMNFIEAIKYPTNNENINDIKDKIINKKNPEQVFDFYL